MIVTIKTIPGFPDYACDEAGNVYRRKNGKLIPKSFSVDKDGCHLVKMSNGKGKFSHTVQRIIAQTFLPDWNEGLAVLHIDEDKTNNKLSNLMLLTMQDKAAVQCKGYSLTSSNKWAASIKINGRKTYLGSFETEEDARLAYLKAKKTLRERNNK